ncbi:unnamed protein product [Ectocarpus sp. 8 AP-2014]
MYRTKTMVLSRLVILGNSRGGCTWDSVPCFARPYTPMVFQKPRAPSFTRSLPLPHTDLFRLDSSATMSDAAAKGGEKPGKKGSPKVSSTSSFWFHEDVSEDLELRSRLNKIMFNASSDFQHVQVVETAPFGKTLVLDGKTQSAQLDEFIYHETLVHPAMLAHPNPKRVYIGGGGELATAREVLRHKTVEKCVMVDLDKLVVDTSRDVLPEWGAGVLDDPRLELHYTDAHAFLRENEDMYDVIIMDIADPIEAGPGYILYTQARLIASWCAKNTKKTQEFYKFATTRLSPGGVLVTQSGAAAVHLKDECFTVIHKTLQSVFQHVSMSVADVPSFGCCWGFNLASDSSTFNTEEYRRKEVAATDSDIEARITGTLRFYDGVTHGGLFGVPKWLRAAVEEEERIMTIDNPVFMY